jgi:hypothetical protein
LGCVSVWRQGNAGKPALGRISNVAIARHSQARQSRSEGETVSWNWRTSEIAMSFLQGFEHDCFISYRHLDDIGLDGMQGHGWVTRFYKAFEATLNQCLGQPSAVFLDPQLDGGSELAPALRQIVCASAVLVPIVSPGYLNSPKYCGEEVNSFREQAKLQGRWSVGNSVLAVRKVVIQPLENDYHNQYPVDEPGYWFFEIDTVTKKSRKFEVGSDGFLNRLSQLADDTAKFLTTLQAQRQSKSTSISVKDANATKKEILLACDASGFDGDEKVKLVSCVAVDQPDELSSRMARFKATLAIDRAFVANADLVDRVRRAGLRYENDEAPLRDRVADELAVLPWDGYVSVARVARALPGREGGQVGVETGANEVRNNWARARPLRQSAVQGADLGENGCDILLASEPNERAENLLRRDRVEKIFDVRMEDNALIDVSLGIADRRTPANKPFDAVRE